MILKKINKKKDRMKLFQILYRYCLPADHILVVIAYVVFSKTKLETKQFYFTFFSDFFRKELFRVCLCIHFIRPYFAQSSLFECFNNSKEFVY